jgi:PPOX class probable F420-dependent enzyme
LPAAIPNSPIPSSHRAILEAPGVAVLTTVGADGFPQSTAVWYLLDGEVIRTSLLETRQKVRNLRENRHATLLAFEQGNPYRTIELRCDASLEPDVGRAAMADVLEHYGQDPETFPDDRTIERVRLTLKPVHVAVWG